jgi:transcriptional regulator
MYNTPYFKEKNKLEVLSFMRLHPFVMLIGCDEENKPVVTQVPVFIDVRDEKIFLSGHIMKESDHFKAFLKNQEVMAVFTGPHTYVSATWYDDPYMGSTWNYMTVQAKGKIRFGDEEELVAVMKRLTLHYENNNNESTTVFDNLPSAYKEKMMKAIVAFEVEVDKIDNVFKLSQNRNEKSYQNIIEKLQAQGGDGKLIAEEMKKRKSQLFSK